MPSLADLDGSTGSDSNNNIFVDELQESELENLTQEKCFEDFERALETLAMEAEFEQYYEDVINMVTQILSDDPENGQTEEFEEMDNSTEVLLGEFQISGQAI